MKTQVTATDKYFSFPTGLASITVAIKNGDCSDAYAFISDVVTYGVIVFSLRQRDSWRHHHNYFHFSPTAGNLRVAGEFSGVI